MSTSRADHRFRTSAARPLTALMALVALLCAGCADLPFQAAWNPFAAAPPAPAAPWRGADGKKQPRLASLIEQLDATVQIDPDKQHGLADLIDLAQRANPETRRAWEDARAAAARLGRVEADWFPTLAAMASAGTSSVIEKAGVNVGAPSVIGPSVTPQLQLSWLLLDFGRRANAVQEASWQVITANLSFNRKHQEI